MELLRRNGKGAGGRPCRRAPAKVFLKRRSAKMYKIHNIYPITTEYFCYFCEKSCYKQRFFDYFSVVSDQTAL